MTNSVHPMQQVTELRLLAAAIELQHLTGTAANVVPIPNTERVIVIGTPADVRRLLADTGPAHLAGQSQAEPVGEFAGYVDGIVPLVKWVKGKMPNVGDKLYLAAPVAQAATASQARPTDLSRRLRETADQQPGWKPLLTAAADEIERYYGGMMAWKQTAEKKDADWNAERMGRVNDRCEARASAQAAAEVRNAALEEAALAAEKVQDDYNERQGGKWPELRDDAATGAGDCATEIRALKSLPAGEDKAAGQEGSEA